MAGQTTPNSNDSPGFLRAISLSYVALGIWNFFQNGETKRQRQFWRHLIRFDIKRV
jgi:hypothetical protein